MQNIPKVAECINCQKIFIQKKKTQIRCPDCQKEYWREYRRQYYHKQKAKGICVKCGKNDAFAGRTLCSACIEKIQNHYEQNREKISQKRRTEEYRKQCRERDQRHRENGICKKCKKKATHGIYCYEHYIQERRYTLRRSQEQKNARRDRGLIPEKRKECGLCLWCGEPAIEGLQCCEKHQQVFIAAGKKGYQAAKENGNNPWINEVENWKRRNRKEQQDGSRM